MASDRELVRSSARSKIGDAHSPRRSGSVLAKDLSSEQHGRGEHVLGDRGFVVKGVGDLGVPGESSHRYLVGAGAGDLHQTQASSGPGHFGGAAKCYEDVGIGQRLFHLVIVVGVGPEHDRACGQSCLQVMAKGQEDRVRNDDLHPISPLVVMCR